MGNFVADNVPRVVADNMLTVQFLLLCADASPLPGSTHLSARMHRDPSWMQGSDTSTPPLFSLGPHSNSPYLALRGGRLNRMPMLHRGGLSRMPVEQIYKVAAIVYLPAAVVKFVPGFPRTKLFLYQQYYTLLTIRTCYKLYQAGKFHQFSDWFRRKIQQLGEWLQSKLRK